MSPKSQDLVADAAPPIASDRLAHTDAERTVHQKEMVVYAGGVGV